MKLIISIKWWWVKKCDSIKYDLSYSFTKPLVSIESLLNISLNDIIYINVYYESLDYTNINQVAKMDEWDLISNIGGNLGLFIGFSFLNLVELIELIIEIIIISVQKKSSSKRKVNSLELSWFCVLLTYFHMNAIKFQKWYLIFNLI